MDDRPCLRCNIPTERGYIPDTTYGGIAMLGWARGLPKPRWLGGIKPKPTASFVAYRCPKCGAVELVAPSTPNAAATDNA